MTFVFVSAVRYYDIAELKLPNQTLENHESVRPLDGIVVKMRVSRKHYVDPESGKFRNHFGYRPVEYSARYRSEPSNLSGM